MTALAVRGLQTAFATERGPAYAVRDVSFDLEDGQTIGLVGESGCGKSMTALSIIGLLPPAARIIAGSVQLDGVGELVGASPRALRRVRGRHVAMVFQDSMTSLNPLLPIGKQIGETLDLHAGLQGRRARVRAAALLEEVGVPEAERRLAQYPHQLSGGLRQRVAVAIALASNPRVLIADEPTTALDVTIQAQLLDLLRREQEQRRMALILITHDLGVVAGMADRIHVMYAGRIVESGDVDRVYAAPRHPYTLGLLRSVPRVRGPLEHRLASIGGSPPPITEEPVGCPFEPRCESSLPACASRLPARIGDDDHGASCLLLESA
jgi:oligopeptide/dipeptide ABC transporter ATP-binding protein